ncbi:MAG TPA: hypothetical protein DD429_06890 [Clostridiaceae bacterium]|nr:hypothetical protein [Clostridiaceae bacterium]
MSSKSQKNIQILLALFYYKANIKQATLIFYQRHLKLSVCITCHIYCRSYLTILLLILSNPREQCALELKKRERDVDAQKINNILAKHSGPIQGQKKQRNIHYKVPI